MDELLAAIKCNRIIGVLYEVCPLMVVEKALEINDIAFIDVVDGAWWWWEVQLRQ